MHKQEPEVIDLTATPQSPEIIVIDSSDEETPAQVPQVVGSFNATSQPLVPARRSPQPRQQNKSRSPKQEEGGSRDQSLRGTAKRAQGNVDTSAVNGKYTSVDDTRESRRDKKRRRGGQSRERTPSRRKRSRSPDRRRTRASPSLDDGSGLFFIDVAPAQVTTSPIRPVSDSLPPAIVDDYEEPAKLLLPAHVYVLDSDTTSTGEVPVKIIPPSTTDNVEDYIEYLDYDDIKATGAVRYFDQEAVGPKKPKFVCKNCGAAGEHKTIDCPIRICLTCGARDEHATRACPIGKTCYTCGMKGHITRTCPNRYSSSVKDHRESHTCQRCGSDLHKVNECPTLWRIYDYHTAQERESVVRARQTKRKLSLGRGGEGYIAMDEWCYNCGQRGHWGDDCLELSRAQHVPNEPSAFSLYNTMSGPFFDSSLRSVPQSPNHERAPRDWEREDVIVDKWGHHAPAHVGKQGRKKERAKLERRAREQEMDEDEGWFRRPDASSDGLRMERRVGPSENKKDRSPAKRLAFAPSLQNVGQSFDPPAEPRSERSLRDRLSGEFDRPPPTQPRGRIRSDSLLERIAFGGQADYPPSGEGYWDERSSYPKDQRDGPARHGTGKPKSKGSVPSSDGQMHEKGRRRKVADEYEKHGPRYNGPYSR